MIVDKVEHINEIKEKQKFELEEYLRLKEEMNGHRREFCSMEAEIIRDIGDMTD